MSDIDVRRAVPDDAHAAADVLVDARAAAAAAGTIPPSVHSRDDVRGWFAGVVLPEREAWLATRDGAVVGVLVMEGDDWLDQLYLAPGCTGQGLGSRLVELAKERRPGGLQLWTFETNLGAQRFYERHGFVEAERTDGSGNEERARDVRYVWRP